MPRAKSKRTRDYEFNATWFERDFEAELDAAKEDFEAETAAPKGSGFKPATNKRLHGYLAAWMRDMKAWGENVRDDIIRLEAAVRMAPGEPGDPPPAPRVR